MGVTLTAGFGVVVKGKAPAVNVTVPAPTVAVSVSNVGFCVPVGVSVGIAWVCVGALVAVVTTAVLVGASVGVGRDWIVCSTCIATVACMSASEMGAGLVAWGCCSAAGMHALNEKQSAVSKKNIFFIAQLLYLKALFLADHFHELCHHFAQHALWQRANLAMYHLAF